LANLPVTVYGQYFENDGKLATWNTGRKGIHTTALVVLHRVEVHYSQCRQKRLLHEHCQQRRRVFTNTRHLGPPV